MNYPLNYPRAKPSSAYAPLKPSNPSTTAEDTSPPFITPLLFTASTDNQSTLLTTATTFLTAYNSPSSTSTTLTSLTTGDYTHHFLPASSSTPAAQNNHTHSLYRSALHRQLPGLCFTMKEIVVDEARGSAVLWVDVRGRLLGVCEDEVRVDELKTESILILWMTADGERVQRCYEYVDLGVMRGFWEGTGLLRGRSRL